MFSDRGVCYVNTIVGNILVRSLRREKTSGMPAQLLSLTDGPSILLDKPILLLGRHPECDIQLNSRKVSRRHCCIAQVQDYLVVRDLGSTNGIRINGSRVLEGKLIVGDELTVGNFKYQLCSELPAEPLAAPKATGKPAKHGPVLSKPVDELFADAGAPIPLSDDPPASRIRPVKPVPHSTPKGRPVYNGTVSEEIIPESLNLIPPSSVQNRPGG